MANDEANAPKFAAFISYAREDEAFAKQLETEIEAHQRPGAARVRVFRDRSDFTGNAYESALHGHLRDSATLLVLCSPDARKSTCVGDEIKGFATLHGTSHIFPILVAGLPDNEADDLKAFPAALVEVMQGRGMPLGAEYRGMDVRRERVSKGRFEAEWYKLLANIYGVPSAEIRDQDQRQLARAQRRRLTASLVVGFVLVLVLVGVAYLWRRAERAEELVTEISDRSQTELSVARAELAKAHAELASRLEAAGPGPAPLPTATPIADTVKLAPRVYFHIRTEPQRATAEKLQRALGQQMREVQVPGIQRLDVGPVRTSELRFYRDSDRSDAEAIAQVLRSAGASDVVAKKIPGFEDSPKIRPRHFELWLKADAPAP